LKITSGTKFFEAAGASDDTSNTTTNAAAERISYPFVIGRADEWPAVYTTNECVLKETDPK
jgi:hypothetical protein